MKKEENASLHTFLGSATRTSNPCMHLCVVVWVLNSVMFLTLLCTLVLCYFDVLCNFIVLLLLYCGCCLCCATLIFKLCGSLYVRCVHVTVGYIRQGSATSFLFYM
jgi:hypothetical protein